jgi:ATP-dependent helicase/nuclease subunit A
MEKTTQQIIDENTKIASDINNSICVSASAGSGKTTILVNRLLNLLINSIDLSKIICLTYTKSGASEMKERIYKALSKLAILDDDELKTEIQKITHLKTVTTGYLNQTRNLFAKVVDNVDNLKIFTIHSFCQQIIGRFPIEAGILPNFTVIEAEQSDELIKKSTESLLMDISKENSIYDDLKLLIQINNENNFYELLEIVTSKRKDFEYIKNYDYKNDLISEFNITTENNDEIIGDFLNYNYADIIRLSDEINGGKFTPNQKEKFSYIKIFLNEKKDENIDKYINVFLDEDKKPKPFALEVKKLNDEYINILRKEQERCCDYIQDMENIKYYKITLAIINVGLEIIKRYKYLKSTGGMLDFDDLIMITLELLQNTEYSAWINYKLDSGIEHILVDEAQDTSTLQWQIIENLVGDFFTGETKNESNRTLFVVGDEKQSIFKFQGANPKMFIEKYNFYKDLIENAKKKFYKIDLKYSFRSVGIILKFVDAAFRDKEYIEKISKLDDKIIHNNIRQGIGLVELWPIIEIEKSERDYWNINFDNDEETKRQDILAKNIAEKIENLVYENRIIIDRNNEGRNIKYSDIMILVRRRDSLFLSYLIRYLNKREIPNSGYDRLDLFENIVVQDFISLFKFILFKNDDLSLANIIKSPIINLKEDDLYILCREKNDSKITLFEAMEILPKYQEQYLFLCDIIEKSKILNIYDLCFYILEDCDIRKKILERFDRNINSILNKFLDFIKKYEENNISSLLSFLYFVENNTNIIKKDLDSRDINQVRIMTVHSSKGMQSPIVFIASATSQPSAREQILWLENKFEYNMPIYKVKSRSDIVSGIKYINKHDVDDEYFRLFYVAMTRAENELYICGWNKNNKGSWYNLAENTMKFLGAMEKTFDFDEKGIKFVYGEALNGKIIEKKEVIDGKSYDNVLKNIVKYESKEAEKKVIAPSQFFNHLDRDNSYQNVNLAILKGNAVHKLLEVLPNSKPQDRENIADIYLNNLFSKLGDENKAFVKKQVFDIFRSDKFEIFFGNNSKSEVEIVGEVDGFMVFGKIDRLVECEDKIIVLDYKSTSHHYRGKKDLPIEYIKQLELYRKLLEKIYEGKIIECYILLTGYGELISIAD